MRAHLAVTVRLLQEAHLDACLTAEVVWMVLWFDIQNIQETMNYGKKRQSESKRLPAQGSRETEKGQSEGILTEEVIL